MKKNKVLLFLTLVISISFFLLSCESKEPLPKDVEETINETEETINETEETIGKKSELLQADFIQFKIIGKDIKLNDLDDKELNAIEIEIVTNFNNILNIETDFSRYIDEIKNGNNKLILIISNTYDKYMNIGDEYIYKLDSLIKIKKENQLIECFSTLCNEYTIMPVLNGEYLRSYVSPTVKGPTGIDYPIDLILLERDVFYGYDVDKHFVIFDYFDSYGDYNSYMLNYDLSLDRFVKVIKALNNEQTEEFYKIQYSELFKKKFNHLIIGQGLDPTELNSFINNYLEEIGGK